MGGLHCRIRVLKGYRKKGNYDGHLPEEELCNEVQPLRGMSRNRVLYNFH